MPSWGCCRNNQEGTGGREALDPKVVDAFLENLDKILAVKEEIDPESHRTSSGFALSERDRSDGLITKSDIQNEEIQDD